MRLINILVLLVLVQLSSYAQNDNKKDSKINWNLDISNRHVWRGGLTLNSFCVKPSANYNNKNLTIGAWSLYSLDNSYNEVDLYIGYKIGDFNITLYDFYCLTSNNKNSDFFDYTKKSNVHMFDLTGSYYFGKEFPLSVMLAATYSNKEARDIEQLNDLSTYIEFNYPTQIVNREITLTLGMAPGRSRYSRFYNKNQENNWNYSQNGLHIVNMGLKMEDKIKINEHFSLPISAAINLNPHQERLYFTFTISLNNQQ